MRDSKLPLAVLDAAFANGGDPRLVEAVAALRRPADWVAYGAWNTTGNRTGSSVFEADAAPSGQVSQSYKGTTWTGTIYRGGVYGGRYLARIVGGAGGLGTLLAARWYREITLRTVLDDIVRETGEKLSSTVLAAVLDRDVPTWTREAGTAAKKT